MSLNRQTSNKETYPHQPKKPVSEFEEIYISKSETYFVDLIHHSLFLYMTMSQLLPTAKTVQLDG